MVLTKGAYSGFENIFLSFSVIDNHILEKPVQYTRLHFCLIQAQGGLSVAGRCRCLTKDSNTSIEKEGYIPYSLQA